MKKKTFKVGALGILLGILITILLLLAAAVTIWGQVKDDYSNDVENAITVLKETEDSISTDYIITGLVLDEDFQTYLDEGVNKGWWTQAFLDQYLQDYSLPILLANYYDILTLLLHSDPAQKLADILGIARDKIPVLIFLITTYWPEIKVRLNYLLDHKDQLISHLSQIKELIRNNKGRISYILTMLPELKIKLINLKAELISKKNDIVSLKSDIISKVEAAKIKIAKLEAKVDALQIKLAQVQHLQDIIKAEGLKSIVKRIAFDKIRSNRLFTNVDGSTFTGKARVFNFLDLYIPKDRVVYDNNGTKANLTDDTLEIPEADIGFEINGNPHIDVLIGQGILIKGARALPLYNAIDMINNKY